MTDLSDLRDWAREAAAEITRLRTDRDALVEALEMAEDVLSRWPFSSEFWPNGMHPAVGIEKIRTTLARTSRQ